MGGKTQGMAAQMAALSGKVSGSFAGAYGSAASYGIQELDLGKGVLGMGQPGQHHYVNYQMEARGGLSGDPKGLRNQMQYDVGMGGGKLRLLLSYLFLLRLTRWQSICAPQLFAVEANLFCKFSWLLS